MTALTPTSKQIGLDRSLQSLAGQEPSTETILERAKQFAIFLEFDGVATQAD